MKKLFALFVVLAVFTAGFKIKQSYNQYNATHLPADTVVYYTDGDAVLHTNSDCKYLSGPKIQKNKFGKVRFSSYLDILCPECVPSQYKR